MRPSAYSTCHAIVPATCFVGTIVLSMLSIQPVLVALSLVGALAFSALARGWRATLRGLRWQLPLLALVCLANPLFSASGSTLVCKLGPRSVYLESLAYGATMGALMVAVVVWFACAAAVLDQDRVLALMGRRARAVPLVVSMAAQLVPQLLGRARVVRAASDACTAAGPRPGMRDGLVRTSTLLLGWALEDSVERADVMRARGWESGCRRTCYRPERLRGRDVAALLGVVSLLLACAACAWVACSRWRFYPRMGVLAPAATYLPFAALALLPAAVEALGRLREGRLS